MSKASKTGVRGLSRDKKGRYNIDLRWRESSTGEYRRYRERLPATMPAAAAKNRAREILTAALAGGFVARKEGPKRLSQAIKRYLEWAEINRPRSLRDRESRTRTLARHLGDPRLDDLSGFRIERYKRDRLKEKARSPKARTTVQPATINREVTLLKHLCGLAVSWGWMSSDIADAIRAVKPLKEPPGRVRYLTDDERSRLFGKLGKLNKGLRPVVEAALLLGMRLSEVITLRKTAVDLTHHNLTLMKTKNNKVRRLPVNEALASVLKQAMAGQESQFVFLNTKGKPYSVGGVSAGFAKAARRAGIEDFHFHDLRHDFATQVRRRGTGLDVIAELLGHSSLAMAQRYAHIGNAELVAAVSGLEATNEEVADVIELKTGSEMATDSSLK